MILIGQFDSPFVRRVAVAMNLYGLAFEHRPWSSFGDAARIAAFNPLRRVPTLVLDDGETLIDSATILDHLDQRAAPHAALIPARGAERRSALRCCALATGLCDKMVSLVYERVLHGAPSAVWVARCEAQIAAALDALEQDRSGVATPFWFGATPGHADIAVACAMRFLAEAHPRLYAPPRLTRLVALAAACEALEPFARAVQPFVPPSS